MVREFDSTQSDRLLNLDVELGTRTQTCARWRCLPGRPSVRRLGEIERLKAWRLRGARRRDRPLRLNLGRDKEIGAVDPHARHNGKIWCSNPKRALI